MKILLLINSHSALYNQRKELIKKFVDLGYKVAISYPDDEEKRYFVDLGCVFYSVEISRHGTNPFKDRKIISKYKKILRDFEPNIVLSYTIKPNLYGALACKAYKIPIICNITGLGTAVENRSLLQKIIFKIYRHSFKSVNHVFVQNEENFDFLHKNKLVCKEKMSLLPGSGVNLIDFEYYNYPNEDIIRFAFVSRIMKEKGIEQYLDCAKFIKNKYCNAEFYICGSYEQEYEDIIDELHKAGIINYKGVVKNIKEVYKEIHCLIHPTYYPEGLSNVLLESCATGRPIITTNRSGCKEVIDDGINGFVVNEKDSNDLIKKVEKFIALSIEDKIKMGLNGRKKVEKLFDRNIIINEYLKWIDKLKK